MFCKLANVYFKHTICLVHGLWFLKKKSIKIHVLFFVMHAWHLNSQQGTGKKLSTEYLIVSALHVGWWFLLNMNTYILTEGTNFKTFLKENYPIDLDSCYIFTNNMLNLELKMMLIVLMEFAYIRNSWTS